MVDNTTNFNYQTSNLLQLLYEAGKSGQINEEERVKLKGIIKISLKNYLIQIVIILFYLKIHRND